MPLPPEHGPLFASYETWKRKGVFWRSAPADIAHFLSSQFSGFDLFELLIDLEGVASKRQFEWTTIGIELMPSGNLRIEHQYDHLDDAEPLILIRSLHCDSPRRVSHEEMKLPARLQRQGLSRELIQPYYRQYRRANVALILVQAGRTGGGYAWAKYGFAALHQVEVIHILDTASERGIDDEAVMELREDLEAFYNYKQTTAAPFPLENWARLPFGEKLLAGTYWKGVLDLHNPAQVQIFEAYLYGH